MTSIPMELERIEANLLQAQHKINAAMDAIRLIKAELNKPVALVPVVPPVAPVTAAPEPAEEPLVINDEWKAVLALMNDGKENLFITGEAGSGKSTLLNHFVNTTTSVTAVVAPTGVAALRVGGQTIHSFFGFGAHALEDSDIPILQDNRRAKYKALEVLVIDEISMVRSDLMDAVDIFLRKNGNNKDLPFGGVRVIMFGDLFQLPPVAKEPDEKKWLEDRYGTDQTYFFHAQCWREVRPKVCELTTIFRQKDKVFTDTLNAIRKGAANINQMTLINSRVAPNFKPKGDELWLTLTTTNDAADVANRKMLAEIAAESATFEAVIAGDFDLKHAPTDEKLELKPGATVMFIRNNKAGGWVNGTIGKVISVKPLKVDIDGGAHDVDAETWESIVYDFDPVTKKLVKTVRGKFTQIPLRLAAAITIHKAQGLTLDRVIIDMGFRAFAPGQAYVALSRCRTLAGMVLRRPLMARDLITSSEVQKFMKGEPIAKPKPQAAQLSLLEPAVPK